MIVTVSIIAALLFGLCLALVLGIATNRGPGPTEVALGYEHAWDQLDFTAIWTLCGSELRDGLDRGAFVAAKRAAYASQRLHALAEEITVEQAVTQDDVAAVQTMLRLRDGQVVRNDVHLVRRGGVWCVVDYALYDGSPADS